MEQEKNTLTVLEIAPGQYPKQVEISDKLMGLPLNRALRDESGEAYDVIAGTFLVVSLGEEDFASLTPELAEKFEKQFHQPESFIPLGRRMLIVPVPDEAVRTDEKKTAPRQPVEHDR